MDGALQTQAALLCTRSDDEAYRRLHCRAYPDDGVADSEMVPNGDDCPCVACTLSRCGAAPLHCRRRRRETSLLRVPVAMPSYTSNRVPCFKAQSSSRT